MNTVELANSREDADAAEAVRNHHAAMAGTLSALTQRLLLAAADRDDTAAERERDALVEWCRHELLPHAAAEEDALYPAAQVVPEARLLVEAMVAEHVVVGGLVHEIAEAGDPVRAAAAARALQVLFETHLEKENERVLPVLLSTPGTSVAKLLGGMHELLGGGEHGHDEGHAEPAGSHGGHDCTCGETDPAGYPELDARTIPHAIRHATIFGALDAVPAQGGLVLVAPHDPLPLLAQVAERYSGAFETSYLERGPEAWRLLFRR